MFKLTKCCFVLNYPIREGLAVGGCVKIVLLLSWLIWFLVTSNLSAWLHPHHYSTETNLYSLFSMKLVVAVVVDIAASILLLFGIRTENEKYVKRIYWYGVVSTISLVHMFGDRFLQVWIWFWYADLGELTWVFIQSVFIIATQAYFTLLVRSHMNNLRDQREGVEQPSQATFYSKAAEAEAQYRAQVASTASLLPY